MKKLLSLALIAMIGGISITSCTNETGSDVKSETVSKPKVQNQNRESESKYNFVINVPANQVTLNGELLKNATEEESVEAISILKEAQKIETSAKRPGGIMCSAGMNDANGWAITMSMDSNNNVRFYFVEWYGGQSYVYQMPGYSIGQCEFALVSWYLGE